MCRDKMKPIGKLMQNAIIYAPTLAVIVRNPNTLMFCLKRIKFKLIVYIRVLRTALEPPQARYLKVCTGTNLANGLWKKSIIPSTICRAAPNKLFSIKRKSNLIFQIGGNK